ncbi:MAG TPA: hypothetical protein VIV60_04590 [Polyangiaceae bacterium]
MPARCPPFAFTVTIIGDNSKTVEGLEQYLGAAGLRPRSMRQLPEAIDETELGDVVVLFPDEFETALVLSAVETMQKHYPRLRLLLVTSTPRTYESRFAVESAPNPIVLPKPAFGWSIVDAIRSEVSDIATDQ